MAAIICPSCHFANPHGALFCQKCYAMLADTIPVGQNTMTLNEARGAGVGTVSANALKVQRKIDTQQLNTHSVALYIESATTPLVFLLTKQAILGRSTMSDAQMRVDLTQFDAVNKGVSRQHLILKRVDRDVTVEDMGSSNGTWLNDVLLQPYRPASLNSSDQLRLGKLVIDVYLPG